AHEHQPEVGVEVDAGAGDVAPADAKVRRRLVAGFHLRVEAPRQAEIRTPGRFVLVVVQDDAARDAEHRTERVEIEERVQVRELGVTVVRRVRRADVVAPFERRVADARIDGRRDIEAHIGADTGGAGANAEPRRVQRAAGGERGSKPEKSFHYSLRFMRDSIKPTLITAAKEISLYPREPPARGGSPRAWSPACGSRRSRRSRQRLRQEGTRDGRPG